jgi:hypothetical protein
MVSAVIRCDRYQNTVQKRYGTNRERALAFNRSRLSANPALPLNKYPLIAKNSGI